MKMVTLLTLVDGKGTSREHCVTSEKLSRFVRQVNGKIMLTLLGIQGYG